MNVSVKVGDGFVKAHDMEAALLGIGKEALHVFKCAGNLSLAVAFQNRNVNEELKILNAVNNAKLHAVAVYLVGLLLLGVDEGNAVLFAEGVVAADVKGLVGFVSDPGAFGDYYVLVIPGFEIFDYSRNYFGVGCCSEH